MQEGQQQPPHENMCELHSRSSTRVPINAVANHKNLKNKRIEQFATGIPLISCGFPMKFQNYLRHHHKLSTIKELNNT